jgi:NADH:ubiquinone oxidoreductase subunit F (NADH-binding)
MSSAETAMTELQPTDRRRARVEGAPALPRLLAGIRAQGAIGPEDHLALHGPLPLAPGARRRQLRDRAAGLIDEIERSGLTGRGGASFPAATKMRAVAGARGRAIVVVNAAEGEPASLKDRTLLETLPHLVLDGALIAAEAVGADELIVCVCESAAASVEATELAIGERSRELARAASAPRVELATVPGHYVAGQETALVNYLGGGPAKPTFTPPPPFEQGLRRRPTLINNAETLAHVALIARHGAGWFRELGTASQPGSTLVTLSGPVAESARIARWLAEQSAHQCGPCIHGLDALATTIAELAAGTARGKAVQRAERLASLTARRGACAHPDGAVNLLLSSLEVFAAEFADHARHGPCDACSRAPELPLPLRPVSEAPTRALQLRR